MKASSVSDQIREFLTQNGFQTGFFCCCQHTEGMPKGEGVCVKPSWSPVDGDHTLMVTPTEVIQLTIRCPYNFNEWSVRSRQGYNNPGELLSALNKLVKQSEGCWA